ncbi:MAG: ribulose-phosphate 3-epimerase [Coxiella sp. RIFCSPHIGHO2_12_FULL_42_15]|nr:MAG: ribulose-phosphate 3-epimerase [Coxiella sp. RIFCSPHIGHO2_12_FULL_42_15]
MKKQILSASILSADFAHLANEVNAVLQCGIDYIHFDVMDHHFVPNLTFGAGICSALRNAGITAPIDVHLMVDDPDVYIEPFAKAGASLITFHPETVTNVEAVVDKIRAHQMGAGLVFNPDKLVRVNEILARKLQMILLMSVFPGFGGQPFMPEVLEKARQVRQWMNQHQLHAYLAIDGGIKVDNIAAAAQAGCDYFVIGSGLFSANHYQERVADFRRQLR